MAQNTPFDSKRGKALKVENAADFIAVFVATGFGSGFIPFAPGTWGSIVGLLVAYGLIAAFGSILPKVISESFTYLPPEEARRRLTIAK